MADGISISKSVARAFRLLELFGAERRPLTAAELGRRLGAPQPSTRALLKTLAGLGYLDYAPDSRTYQPSRRLALLGRWLDEDPVHAALATAVDRLAAASGETASLCTLRDGRVEILHVCKARHPVALQLEPGLGAEAWRSAVGRVLLAQLPDADAAGLIRSWLRQSRAAARRALEGLPRELKRIRREGHFAGYDLFLPGVGAVCLPAAARGPAGPGAVPLAIAVAGLRDRIRPRESQLARQIAAELAR